MQETRLWQSVLAQALIDAIHKNEFDYFDIRNPDFILVCGFADINPKCILTNLKTKQMLGIKILNSTRRIRRGKSFVGNELANHHDSWTTDYEQNPIRRGSKSLVNDGFAHRHHGN